MTQRDQNGGSRAADLYRGTGPEDFRAERSFGEWRVAIRLAEDAAGNPVIAEVRVFPDPFLDETKAGVAFLQRRGTLNRWNGWGEWRQDADAPLTPEGGVTARLLESIPLTPWGDATVWQAQRTREFMVRLRSARTQLNKTIRETPHPRRKGRQDRFLALVAASYVRHVKGGEPHPNKAMAEEAKCPVTTMARRVAEARKQGYLTHGTRGKPGGELTSKARELLGVPEEEA